AADRAALRQVPREEPDPAAAPRRGAERGEDVQARAVRARAPRAEQGGGPAGEPRRRRVARRGRRPYPAGDGDAGAAVGGAGIAFSRRFRLRESSTGRPLAGSNATTTLVVVGESGPKLTVPDADFPAGMWSSPEVCDWDGDTSVALAPTSVVFASSKDTACVP